MAFCQLSVVSPKKNDVAVCVFGSKARSSHDFLSDKDVLLTASEVSKAYSQAQVWSAEGWSVTVYSHSRLVHMASIGSLFVQHLKQEGRILNDPGHWLGDLLNDFSPKACYAEDAESSFDLIRPLERIIRLKSGSHLASDLGYVFMRNYAINRLASEQIYLYDYKSLMEELQGIEGFSNQSLNLLIGLREGKHTYRSGVAHVARSTLGMEIAETIEEACSDLTFDKVSNGTGIRRFKMPYATLRDCEAALIANTHEPALGQPNARTLLNIWRMIKRPRDYSWQIRSIDDNWIAHVNRVVFGEFPKSFTRSDSIYEPLHVNR